MLGGFSAGTQCDLRDRNAFIEVTDNGVYIGRCKDTGRPLYADPQTILIPAWMELIADRANQSQKKPTADDRIVELRGTMYAQDFQHDYSLLDNLFDAGLKKIYWRSTGWSNRWTTFESEVQSLGTSHLPIAQRYLGTPIVIHGRTQFKTCGMELLPEYVRQSIVTSLS